MNGHKKLPIKTDKPDLIYLLYDNAKYFKIFKLAFHSYVGIKLHAELRIDLFRIWSR